MSLLELDNVTKAYGRGAHRPIALRNVTLSIDEGELVAVWGMRRSGRSTLMRVVAGIERPDSGNVRYREALVRGSRDQSFGGGIGYCRKTFSSGEGPLVFDQLLSGQEALGMNASAARMRVRDALSRVEAEHCATARTEDLSCAEAMRVAIARTLTLRPSLVVVDEPTIGVDLMERDPILHLLRSIADDDVAVLMSTGDTPCLAVADRALTITNGELRGRLTPKIAPVLTLHAAAQSAA